MSNTVQDGLQTPGEVSIEELSLISTNGKSISLIDYLIELNLYETNLMQLLTTYELAYLASVTQQNGAASQTYLL